MVKGLTTAAQKIFIVDGKRTPYGKFGGSLQKIDPVDLSVISTNALLGERKISPDKIGQVIFCNVIPPTTETIYGGRHVALKTGMPIEVPAYTVNRMCGSGIQGIMDAFRLIKLNEYDSVLVAGGENMSMVPHLVYGSRFGTRFGALKTVDLLFDTLSDKIPGLPMGVTADNLGKKFEITREQSDQFAYESHAKAIKAYENNLLQPEIVPIPLKRGVCEKDEHIRTDASFESMQNLRPFFSKDGLVTAASASGMVDGAGSVLIASEKFCNDNGLTPIAEIVESSVIGVPPELMGYGPSPAIKMLLEKTETKLQDVDLFEINEAFSPQALSVAKDLDIDKSRLNIWGGAVAIGHPLGGTGIRLAHTLSRQLKETNGKLGIASACIGGGQGIAMMIRSM